MLREGTETLPYKHTDKPRFVFSSYFLGYITGATYSRSYLPFTRCLVRKNRLLFAKVIKFIPNTKNRPYSLYGVGRLNALKAFISFSF